MKNAFLMCISALVLIAVVINTALPHYFYKSQQALSCDISACVNDNISDIMAVVKNGEPFNAYINGMPLKFILGKNEQFNAYNPDFYKVGATLPTQLPGWFKLHKEDTYYFSATTTQYESIWSDFTNVNEGNNTVDESDTKKYLTEESLFNIVEFKLQ